MRVSSPPVTGPCYYGIDTPIREELIAANTHAGRDRDSTSASIPSDISRSTACSASVPGGPERILPRVLLGRLPHAAARPTRTSCVSGAGADRRAAHLSQLVYFFGNGKADGTRTCGPCSAAKAPNLAEMTNLGVPVPPGFTIACDVLHRSTWRTAETHRQSRLAPRGGARNLEAARDRDRTSDSAIAKHPLLVSVRRGAPHVDARHDGDHPQSRAQRRDRERRWRAASGNARFAYDSYRRFIQMYGDVVLERALATSSSSCLRAKRMTAGVDTATPNSTTTRCATSCEEYKTLVRSHAPARISRRIRGAALGRDRGGVAFVDAQEGGGLPPRERDPRDRSAPP